MSKLYVLGLGDGRYRHVSGSPGTVQVFDEPTAKKALAGYPDGFLEPFMPFEAYPTEFSD